MSGLGQTKDQYGIWYFSPTGNLALPTDPAALYTPTGLLISALPTSPARTDVLAPRSITFTLAGSPSVTINVVEDKGNLDFTLTTADINDLSGLFFDFTNSKLSTLKVTGDTPIQQTHAGGVVNLTFGANGLPSSDALVLPSPQINHSESFVLSDKADNLSINDLHPTGETGTVGVTTLLDEGRTRGGGTLCTNGHA